jgi:hypothetical protein
MSSKTDAIVQLAERVSRMRDLIRSQQNSRELVRLHIPGLCRKMIHFPRSKNIAKELENIAKELALARYTYRELDDRIGTDMVKLDRLIVELRKIQKQ